MSIRANWGRTRALLARLGAWRCARRVPQDDQVRPDVEPLEARVLLSSVTLVTHGYQMLSSNRPPWLDCMKDAIVARAGPDTAVYALRVNAYADGTPYVESLNWLSGAAPSGATTSNADTVVMLDWAAASGVVFSYTNTAAIAQLVAPLFLGTAPSLGLYHPLGEVPIHLIGHSRGASVVSELARDLASQGLWVDQVTTLDPHPVWPDPAVQISDNVFFADNYYQTDDFFVTGSPVAGAHNVNLSGVVTSHTNVHTYYQGTIDTTTHGPVDGVTISDSWYAPPGCGPRNAVGFDWTRLVGGLLPADGLAIAGATRQPTTLSVSGANVWDNSFILNHQSDMTITRGEALSVEVLWGDGNRDATMAVGLDVDSSPYDGVIAGVGASAATSALVSGVWSAFVPTNTMTPGVYRIWSGITNGTHTRYDYAPGKLTILPDTQAPTAQLNAGTLAADRYTFSVTYADNVAIRRAAIDVNDLRVDGPNGYSQAAALGGVTPSGSDDRPTLTATYWVPAPPGSWDFLDNGTYTIAARANEIADISGNPLPAGLLGTFEVAVEAPATMSVPSGITDVGGAFWIGAAHTATKSGLGTLNINGPQSHQTGASFRSTDGTTNFNTDAGGAAGRYLTVEVDPSTVNFNTTQHLAGLSVEDGSVANLSGGGGGGKVLVTDALTLTGSGRLDLFDNDLIVDYAPAPGGSPAVTVTDYLRAGFNAAGLRWDGPGIASTTARDFADQTTTLGVIDNADPDGAGPLTPRVPVGGIFAGEVVDDSMVLVKYTYFGDVTFDGTVDAADYALIDNGFNFQNDPVVGPGLRNWANGDMNFDGAIDAADYALIDNAFNFQSGALAGTANVPAQLATEGAGQAAAMAPASAPAIQPAVQPVARTAALSGATGTAALWAEQDVDVLWFAEVGSAAGTPQPRHLWTAREPQPLSQGGWGADALAGASALPKRKPAAAPFA